jgi:hypothetical protein
MVERMVVAKVIQGEHAEAGGLIRDSMGSWVQGFAINTGVYSSVRAELRAVIIGLELP